ncbi:DNA polymerase III PolC-type [Paenibacillus sp. P1XP2]|nr:DNA polymerase III PolC-type [Paenibacillus sp. P1XP2]
MDKTGEKRKRFELLMKQGEIPPGLVDPYFLDGYIEQVETSRSNKEWIITIVKETLVPAEVYRNFCLKLREKMQHIAKITFIFKYDPAVGHGEIVDTYWNLFLEWVHREIPSVNGWMARAGHELDGDMLLVTMSDSTSLELARKNRSTRPSSVFISNILRSRSG